MILPLNVENNHWISLEIVLFYDPQNKKLKADIWQHDPYGSNGEAVNLQQYEDDKFERQLKLLLKYELSQLQIEYNQNQSIETAFKKSPYERRQQDGSSCGGITIEDVILLAQGKTLNNRLFLEGAPKLRQQHQQIYNQTIQNNNMPTQKPPLPKTPIRVEKKIENEKESKEQFSSIYSQDNNLVKNPVKQNPLSQKKNNDEKVLNLN